MIITTGRNADATDGRVRFLVPDISRPKEHRITTPEILTCLLNCLPWDLQRTEIGIAPAAGSNG